MNIVRILAAESGKNIVIGDDVKGKISIALRNVPWEQALDTILAAKGLEKIERDGVIRIVSQEQREKEREIRARAEEAARKADVEIRAKAAEAHAREIEARARQQEAQRRRQQAEDEAEADGRPRSAHRGHHPPLLRRRRGGGQDAAGPARHRPRGHPAQAGRGDRPARHSRAAVLDPLRARRRPRRRRAPVPPEVLEKRLTIRAYRPTNTLFLRLYRSDIEQIRKLIRESIDIPVPQVKIEARMEILDRSALEQIGIQWGGFVAKNAGSQTLVGQGFNAADLLRGGTPVQGLNPPNTGLTLSQGLPVSALTGLPLGGNVVNLPISTLPTQGPLPTTGIAFGIIGTNLNVNLALQALAEQGKTRTLARPEIVTVENNLASIELGEEIPYTTVSSAGTQIQFKKAALRLDVTPTVVKEDDHSKIRMVVMVENNSRGDVVNLGAAGTPAGHQHAQGRHPGPHQGGRAPRHRRHHADRDARQRPQGARARRHPHPGRALSHHGELRAGPRAGGVRDAERAAPAPAGDAAARPGARPACPWPAREAGTPSGRDNLAPGGSTSMIIPVQLGAQSYTIVVERGALRRVAEHLRELRVGRRVALVSSPEIIRLHGKPVADHLREGGFEVAIVEVPDGEAAKRLAVAERCWDALLEAGLDRTSTVVALGGGAVGDVAGFTAATYMRGVNFVQLPTTILAQVDASSGGKTAIDHPTAKNLIGAFHQPRLVIVDPQTIDTLPERDFRSGLAEVVKHGVVLDAAYFALLEREAAAILARDPAILEEVIGGSCRLKASVVERDALEADLRAVLNYGHTLGHALEAASGYGRWTHGEAVAIGMVGEARLARRRGLASEETVARQERLLDAGWACRSMRPDTDVDAVLAAITRDKKSKDGRVPFVLAPEIGAFRVEYGIPREDVRAVLEGLLTPAAR